MREAGESQSYAARVVYSEQARMSPPDMDRSRLMARPVEETPLQRFLTVNGADEPNNMYARDQMQNMGIGMGDEKSIHVRRAPRGPGWPARGGWGAGGRPPATRWPAG